MLEAPKQSRAVNLFTVPPSVKAEAGISEVGLVTLTADDELMAYQRGRKDGSKIALELAKASLVEADGKPLSLADGSADSFWLRIHPKLRQLVMEAYSELHAVEPEESQSFLGSRKVRQG